MFSRDDSSYVLKMNLWAGNPGKECSEPQQGEPSRNKALSSMDLIYKFILILKLLQLEHLRKF